eukprot:9336902-Lingulodinium_polyedra.AAC.1
MMRSRAGKQQATNCALKSWKSTGQNGTITRLRGLSRGLEMPWHWPKRGATTRSNSQMLAVAMRMSSR